MFKSSKQRRYVMSIIDKDLPQVSQSHNTYTIKKDVYNDVRDNMLIVLNTLEHARSENKNLNQKEIKELINKLTISLKELSRRETRMIEGD